MAIKTNGNGGRHNSYTFFPSGKHSHSWYNPSTGQMGYHGENASPWLNKVAGRAAAASTNGSWLKGVKGPKMNKG